MDDCKNVIEDLVVQEIKTQLEGLTEEMRSKISISEVAAYALNRLIPLYATSRNGWQQQRQRALSEFKDSIHQCVRRGIVAVRRDTLREPDPLPPEELMSEARALSQVRKVLNRSDLTWNEVPKAFEEALKTIRIRGTLEYAKIPSTRRSAMAIQEYLKRKKSKDANWEGKDSFAYYGDSDEAKEKQEREFLGYIQSAGCDFVNVLEKLVFGLATRYLERTDPGVRAKVNLYEVVAYTLNRLPPMYATTTKGLKQLRFRAKEEHGKVIISTIHKAVSIIVHNPHRSIAPLPFKRKQGDSKQALDAIKAMLQINDVDFGNVAMIMEDALDLTISGELTLAQNPF